MRTNTKSFGTSPLLGFSLIPLLLFFQNAFLKIPLDYASYFVFIIAITSIIFSTFKYQFPLKSYLKNPTFLITLIAFIGFIVCGNINYEAYSSDEFSHWLTMPKQVFLFKNILSNRFIVTEFLSYTPGLPLILAYPSFIISRSFLTAHALYILFFPIPLFIGFLFELFKSKSFPYIDSTKKRITVIIAIFLLPLIVTYLSNVFVYIDLSIPSKISPEFLLFYLTFTVFLLMWDEHNSPSLRYVNFSYIGLLLGVLYLLKHSTLPIVPVVLIFACLQKDSKLGMLKRICFSIGPFIIVYLSWQFYLKLNGVNELLSPIPVENFNEILLVIKERIYVIKLAIKELIKVPYMNISPYGIIGGLGLAFAFKARKQATFIFYLLLFFFINFTGLIWMYLTSFQEYEVRDLVSFHRYIGIPFHLFIHFGILFFFNFLYSKFFNKKVLTLYSILVSLSVVLLLKVRYGPIEGGKNKVIAEFTKEVKMLQNFIKEKKITSPKLQIIAQEGIQYEYNLARYFALDGDHLNFIPQAGTYFGENKGTIYQYVFSFSKMKKTLNAADIIMILKSDSWIDSVVQTLDFNVSCKPPYENYFIYKENNQFNCIDKSEYKDD